jgi:hypothetical protein
MGFFSWITQDTGLSISNKYSDRGAFPVVMIDNQNNKWIERDYDGYGDFGGKDFYELLAEMNGKSTREEGIDLYFRSEPFISPNLISLSSIDWWEWSTIPPKDCDNQGYFYKDDDEEDEY